MSRPAIMALSPEAQLLYRTVAERPDDQAIRTLLAGPLDWSRVTRIAHREQALTVLWRVLSRYPEAIAPAQANQLSQLAQVAEFHLLHLQHRFEQSVAALTDAGIDVLLLKGAGLVYTAYGSFSARPMSDVDLLVRPGQAAAAQALLGSIGWDWERDPESAKFYENHHHLPPLFDTRGGGANLELHTALFIAGHPLGLSAELVWAHARPVQVAGRTAYVAHPHHQLLHACLHFAWGHAMQSGAWRTFRDVGAIVGTGAVDWDEFVRLAEEMRAASCCYWTFDLAKTVGGVTVVPEAALLRLRPPIPRVVRERLRRHLALMVTNSDAATPSVKLDRFIWEAAIMPDYYGHGLARPWAQEDRLLSGTHGAPGARRAHGLAAQLHKLQAYTRYLRKMLTR